PARAIVSSKRAATTFPVKASARPTTCPSSSMSQSGETIEIEVFDVIPFEVNMMCPGSRRSGGRRHRHPALAGPGGDAAGARGVGRDADVGRALRRAGVHAVRDVVTGDHDVHAALARA